MLKQRIAVFLIAFLCVAFPAVTAILNGRQLRGVVLDESGAVIPGAKVRLENAATGERSDAVSDQEGHFEFHLQGAADCVLFVRAKGFEEAQLPVKAEKINGQVVRVLLEVVENQERVRVSATADAAPSANDNLDSLAFDDHFLRDLPLKNGDPLEVASLYTDPGTVGEKGPQLLIDGAEADSLDLPTSSIRELVVNRTPYSAEYSRPGKARIEVTTKHGSHHRMHGSAFTLVRNDTFNARNAFATDKPPHERVTSEMELDGPLSQKIAVTVSGRYEINNDSVVANALLPSGPVVENIRMPERFLHLFGRIDYRTSPSHKWMLTYKFLDRTRDNQKAGGFDLPDRGINDFTHQHEARLTDLYTISERATNQAIISLKQERNDKDGLSNLPAIMVDGAFNSGSSQVFLRDTQKAAYLEDFIGVTRGRNLLRFGGGVRLRYLNGFDASDFGGTYSFASLPDYVNAQPYLFTLNSGNPNVAFTQHDGYTFVSDELRLGERASLYGGLRYEVQSNVPYRKNFGPRLAFAYSPASSWVLRAGGGIFYDRPPVSMLEDSLLYDGIRIHQAVLQNPSYPLDPLTLAGLPSATPSRISVASNLRMPYLLQGSVALERKLFQGRSSISVEYMNIRGVHMFRTRDINAPFPDTFIRPRQDFVVIDQYESSGFSRTQNLTVTLKAFTRSRFNLVAQYIYSRAKDDTSGLGGMPANNYDLRGEYGWSDFDRRHRLNITGSYRLPLDVRLGSILKFWSGVPYDITTGFDDNQDTVANDRPPGVPRNSGRGAGFADVDVRLARDFALDREARAQLRVGIDAFNVFNHASYNTYVGTLNSPLFGRPITAYAARQLQFSIRFKF